jgi:glutathione synthase
MKFLYIVDPAESLDLATDTTLALIDESARRGIHNFACRIEDICLKDGKAHMNAAPCAFKEGDQAAKVFGDSPKLMNVDEFSVVFMRKDPPVDERYVAALLMLSCYDPKKTVMVNRPQSIMAANEKLYPLSFASKLSPQTLVASNLGVIRKFAEGFDRVVLKPLYGHGGAGVLVLAHDDKNFASAFELLTRGGAPVVVQEYVKNAVAAGDKRILLLGGEPLGAILRKAKSSDHRANFHAGGTTHDTTITEAELAIIEAIAPKLREMELHLVGIDVIDGFLTEINVTSPTCLRQMEGYLGAKTLRATVIDYVLNLVA